MNIQLSIMEIYMEFLNFFINFSKNIASNYLKLKSNETLILNSKIYCLKSIT